MKFGGVIQTGSLVEKEEVKNSNYFEDKWSLNKLLVNFINFLNLKWVCTSGDNQTSTSYWHYIMEVGSITSANKLQQNPESRVEKAILAKVRVWQKNTKFYIAAGPTTLPLEMRSGYGSEHFKHDALVIRTARIFCVKNFFLSYKQIRIDVLCWYSQVKRECEGRE